MSRVVTASEVDKLHEQVANLAARVGSLEGSVYGPPVPAPNTAAESPVNSVSPVAQTTENNPPYIHIGVGA